MQKVVINYKVTNLPFSCSDELIEQGVDNFRPILDAAGVFRNKKGKKNKYHQRMITRDYHSARNSFRARAVLTAMEKAELKAMARVMLAIAKVKARSKIKPSK